MKINDIKEGKSAILVLKNFLLQRGFDIGHADRFLNVGEFQLAFEEIFYGVKNQNVQLSHETREVFDAAKEFFEVTD